MARQRSSSAALGWVREGGGALGGRKQGAQPWPSLQEMVTCLERLRAEWPRATEWPRAPGRGPRLPSVHWRATAHGLCFGDTERHSETCSNKLGSINQRVYQSLLQVQVRWWNSKGDGFLLLINLHDKGHSSSSFTKVINISITGELGSILLTTSCRRLAQLVSSWLLF